MIVRTQIQRVVEQIQSNSGTATPAGRALLEEHRSLPECGLALAILALRDSLALCDAWEIAAGDPRTDAIASLKSMIHALA